VIFQSTILIFFFQMMLCTLIFQEIVFSKSTDLRAFENLDVVIFARFIAALVLHIALMDEVQRSMLNMKFVMNHTYVFENWGIAFMAGSLQFCSIVFVEVICIVVICLQKDPLDITFNFIALAVIGDFDEMLFEAFEDSLKKIVDKEEEDERPLFVVQHTTSSSARKHEKSSVLDEEGNKRPLKI
jgi:hypothetical protein